MMQQSDSATDPQLSCPGPSTNDTDSAQREEREAGTPVTPDQLPGSAWIADLLSEIEQYEPDAFGTWLLDPPKPAPLVNGSAENAVGSRTCAPGPYNASSGDVFQPHAEPYLSEDQSSSLPSLALAAPLQASTPPAPAILTSRQPDARSVPFLLAHARSVEESTAPLESAGLELGFAQADFGNLCSPWLLDHVYDDVSRSNEQGNFIAIAPRPEPPQPTGERRVVGLESAAAPTTNKRKRKQFDEAGRGKVKKVRTAGACFRCKIYKLSCSEKLPCESCLKNKDKINSMQRLYHGPCIRLNIDDVQTFRAGDGDNGTTRPTLPKYEWKPGSIAKTVGLQWSFRRGIADTPVLNITCQQFQPDKHILDEEYSLDSVVHRVKFQPWACFDAEGSCEAVEKFVIACQDPLESEIRETLRDSIVKLVWNEAVRYRAAHGTPLVARALQIYAGAMMNSRYPLSTEADAFDAADPVHTPYFFEKLPLPPQLTYQVQTMIAIAMMKVQVEVLKELRTRVFAKDRIRHWYEAFLTIFLLLATIEQVYQIQIRFLQAKQGVATRNFTNLSYVTQHMFDEWESSAFNLIGHFRCVMNGEIPFAQSWDDDAENPRRTGLDPEALHFLRQLQQQIHDREIELLAPRKAKGKLRFEQPLGAICELFLSNEPEA